MTRGPATVTQHDVRPARRRDLAHLAAIEDSGLALFEDALGDLTGSPLATPAPSGEERAGGEGFVLVAGDPPVGFAHVALLGGHPHLDQLSVHPEAGRRGIGTALVEAACDRLAARGYGQLTLTTYADLPWNAPYYARLGFTEVDDAEPLPGPLVRVRRHEADLDLARHGRRVLMRRVLRRHRTTEELEVFRPRLDACPRDRGTLALLVRRPAEGVREVLSEGLLDVHEGLVGDNWRERGSRRMPDRTAHPDMQLNIMNHALVEFLAQDPEREALSGDQLFLDLDLSHENLPVWSELHIGGPDGAVIVVTDQPHTGCGKFIARYGKESMTFVNSPAGKAARLRGLCAKVVRPGPVRPGDEVVVVRPGEAPDARPQG